MKRIATIIAVFVALLSISVAKADEPSKEQVLKSWAVFVGTWKFTRPDNTTHVVTITKTKSGAFVHKGRPDVTVVVGWDTREKNLKALGFDEAGAFVDSWKLVGDGPKFEGKQVFGRDFSAKITFFGRDRFEFVVAGTGKTVGERVK